MMPGIRVGDPGDPETWIGPIRVERTRLLLDRALAALDHPRYLFEPRRDGEWQGPFLVEVADPPDLELFGPFLALVPVQSDAEALSRVLRSRYPFLAVWFGTPPPGGKERLLDTFGMTHDNPDFLFTPLRLPFGGKGESGWIIENRGALSPNGTAPSFIAPSWCGAEEVDKTWERGPGAAAPSPKPTPPTP